MEKTEAQNGTLEYMFGKFPNRPRQERAAESALSKDQRYVIESLEKPIENILTQLSPKIERGEYGLIVGDDASGRVPALILRSVIDAAYEKHGYKKAVTRFVAGTRFIDPDQEGDKFGKEVDFFIRLKDKMGASRRALVVTDTIHTGESIVFIVDALKAAGIQADVAAIAKIRSGVPLPESLRDDSDLEIAAGSATTPAIHTAYPLAGVGKFPEDLHARRLDEEQRLKYPGIEPLAYQATVNATRELAKDIAARLVTRYESVLGQDISEVA